MPDAFARCVAFTRGMQERGAERSVRTEHGVVHLAPTLPGVWYRNFLAVDLGAEATAEALVAEVEAVQGPAGLRHRRVSIDDELGARIASAFRTLGWKVEELLVMVHGDDITTVPPETVELGAETLAPVWARGIAEHDPDEETVRQLVAAQLARCDAVDVRYFAVAADGQVAAYCELFSREGIGQIESVMTLEEFRGRGFGKAVVSRAVAESVAAGHDLTFLLADADDWPKELYRKLGFEEVGRIWDFTREPPPRAEPLLALCVRTPRLELRLASREELVELGQVAQAGIHPPDEMPFLVPWTDRAGEPRFVDDFVAFHEGSLTGWDPQEWSLNLIVFHGGRPIGSQSIRADRFAETRVVDTGSWLGREFQGRGLGTEMRAAVIELAFRGLGAEAVTSGAFEHNVASSRVSEKLGYEQVGEEIVHPRGKPVRERVFRLERSRWQTPFEIEIDGLEPCLPLLNGPS